MRLGSKVYVSADTSRREQLTKLNEYSLNSVVTLAVLTLVTKAGFDRGCSPACTANSMLFTTHSCLIKILFLFNCVLFVVVTLRGRRKGIVDGSCPAQKFGAVLFRSAKEAQRFGLVGGLGVL